MGRFVWTSLNTGLVLWLPALYLGAWALSYVHERVPAPVSGNQRAPLQFWELALGAIPSFALTLWGAIFYAANERGTPNPRPWTATAVTAIAVASLGLLIFQAIRVRGRPGALLGYASVLLGLFLTAIGWFVALMSVVNDWV